MITSKFRHELKYKLIFFLTLTILTSCSDFVNVVPEDRIDATAFNSTDQELLITLNGAYRLFGTGLQVGDSPGSSMFMMLEARSDNAFMDHTDLGERVATDIFLENPSSIGVNTCWAALYKTVNLCNLVIKAGSGASGDPNLINRIIGEAKFLRAYNYFFMVNFWGGVPLRLTPTIDFDNLILPRATLAEVYDQIVKDLTESIQVLPESYNKSSGNEVGRATRYAALTLLGKVELQRGNKPAAETALRKVYGKYSLLPKFKDIHAPGNNNTAESIFEVDYNPNIQTGSNFWRYIPNSVALKLGIASGGYTRAFPGFGATQDLIDAFDNPADLRIPYTYGLLAPGMLPGGYITKYLDLTAASFGSDVNIVTLRYADVLLMLAESIGEGTEAYKLINIVRARAGLPDVGTSTPGTFTHKLLKERRLEFAFEMQRWLDLLRLPQNETLAMMRVQLAKQQAFFMQFPTYIWGTTFNLSTNDLLYPIPQIEIDVSGGVVIQNP